MIYPRLAEQTFNHELSDHRRRARLDRNMAVYARNELTFSFRLTHQILFAMFFMLNGAAFLLLGSSVVETVARLFFVGCR